MNHTKISVIMPVYNTKQWVWEAIESILNQTFKEFEFIIVDDCSTDGSYEICKEYAKKDKRIRLYRNEKNSWVAFTKNKLIELSSTAYIASQDSDDISFLNRLELEYEFLENHKDYAVVSGNNVIINEEWKKIWHRKYSDNIKNIILKKSPVSHPTTMIRKSDFLAVWWYTKVKYVEDYDLWIKFYTNWYNIKNLDKYLLYYRIRKGAQKWHVKETIKWTLDCQKRAYNKIKPSISDRIYHTCLHCLLLLPKSIILKIFNIIEFSNKK
jgi:glycosyltransferase involved in cell wall biosynthesis